jgi:hypothetical protein
LVRERFVPGAPGLKSRTRRTDEWVADRPARKVAKVPKAGTRATRANPSRQAAKIAADKMAGAPGSNKKGRRIARVVKKGKK